MRPSNSSATQWGKLTSLDPNFDNVSLSKQPSNLIVSREGLQETIDKNPLSKGSCQIYQKKDGFFISYTGSRLCIEIEERTLKEDEAFKIHSGERIVVTFKKIRMEYIFSGELLYKEKEIERSMKKLFWSEGR